MSRVDLTTVQEYFRRHLAEHGEGARGMDWKDEDTQELRFEVISRYLQPRSAEMTVLDVGCGSGEFHAFSSRQNLNLTYTGLDVCEEMVEACRRRFGEDSAVVGRADELPFEDGHFDFCIASGTFNAKLTAESTQWHDYVCACLQEMYRVCRVAVVANFMSFQVDYTYDRLYYPALDELLPFVAQSLSRRLILDHCYPLYEMTLAIYRPGGEQE